ncbi:hypothetical protein [Haloglomus halophilum]|uniref:hypothetical protein n=1 Tax=Haloglomus halophilum TaxID=2962672 RepID=UPI0020C9D9B8|nr:hypothetical protein [Haloglomus halophilum]
MSADAAPDPPESFRVAAEQCADYWDDYPLDFTPQSLRHLDSLVDTYYGPEDAADAADSDPEALSGVAVQFGSYFGETLVRSHDGEWQQGRLNWSVALEGPDGEATVNVFGVAAGALAEPAAFYETYREVASEIGLV